MVVENVGTPPIRDEVFADLYKFKEALNAAATLGLGFKAESSRVLKPPSVGGSATEEWKVEYRLRVFEELPEKKGSP